MQSQRDSVTENLTIRQLEVFAMASQSASFSEAAKRLGISQPSLSNTVAKIETQLGLRLFDRTTRTMVLTPQGKRLAIVADELVRNFRASLQNIDAEASELRGRLSLAVIPTVAAAVGPAALERFFDAYPGFVVGLHDVAGEKALAWVLERVVDCAIVATPATTSDLVVEHRHRDRFEVVCRRDHPLAKKRAVSWKDIAGASVILAGSGAIHRDVETAGAREGVTVQPRFSVEQIMTGLSMVNAGLGIAILPGLCRPGHAYPELASVPMGRAGIVREIAIIRRSDRVLSEPARHLMACFADALEAAV